MSRSGRAPQISMTQAELAALIQEHVNGALANLQNNNINNVNNVGNLGGSPPLFEI